jgi:hypothetical protein
MKLFHCTMKNYGYLASDLNLSLKFYSAMIIPGCKVEYIFKIGIFLNFYRPIEVPEEQGSKVEGNEDQDQLPCFILGKSRSFPIEILFTDKVKYFVFVHFEHNFR